VADETPIDEQVLCTIDGGIARVTINRPEAGNSLTAHMRDTLSTTFDELSASLGVRCVVLTGAGERHFCTGADLTVRQPAKPKPDGAPDMVAGTATQMMRVGFQRLMQAMLDCQKPVIVALNGTAAGGGSMFVLAADLVIAADTAKIIQVFVRRGLIPDGGVAYLLPRIVGMHKAKELIFFGDDLPAADAERLGIVNKVVPAADLHAATKEWAERLASGPTKAIGWAKRLLHDASELSRRDLLEEEAMLVEQNSSTVDSGEVVAAFRERRTPEWKGW